MLIIGEVCTRGDSLAELLFVHGMTFDFATIERRRGTAASPLSPSVSLGASLGQLAKTVSSLYSHNRGERAHVSAH